MLLEYMININIEEIKPIIEIIKNFFVCLCGYYTTIRITNSKNNINFRTIILIFIIALISSYVKEKSNLISSILIQILFIATLYSFSTKNKIEYALIIAAISLSLTNIIYFISILLDFFVNVFWLIKNDYINLIIILIFDLIILTLLFKIKRIRNGIVFLRENLKNEYFDILILNVSIMVLCVFSMFTKDKQNLLSSTFFLFIFLAFIMFITIQKSLQLYYKQKMLVKDLEETKAELEEKKKEVEELEKENLEFSKVSHSIAHKQRALEFKLNELSMKTEIADEIAIKDRIKNLNKDLRKEPVIVLDKTEIPEIDDMLDFMQSECIENKIDFQLQLSGNLYTMINHYIDKEDLEILLADHIKNAIIAIGYGDNDNKSILVRLGKLDGNYGLYIYDSGIEFEIETLLNLGKKPSTTHKDSGGTGMGFMNTFDTLRKYEASFIIEEYGEPVTDNFTKALKFKFDKKEEFRICSYRDKEIKNKDTQNILEVEKLIF